MEKIRRLLIRNTYYIETKKIKLLMRPGTIILCDRCGKENWRVVMVRHSSIHLKSLTGETLRYRPKKNHKPDCYFCGKKLLMRTIQINERKLKKLKKLKKL